MTVVKRRQQLAHCQVARAAENDQVEDLDYWMEQFGEDGDPED